MRRLPVYLVVDVSESMIGAPLNSLEHAITTIIGKLRQDPVALETVHISIIAFAGVAKQVVNLVDLVTFYPPKLPIGGGTAFGAALTTLMAAIDKELVRNTIEVKGDWEPLVYLITDGKPTDAPQNAIDRWNKEYSKNTQLTAVTIGNNADIQILNKITDNIVAIEKLETQTENFVQWISSSISMTSSGIESTETKGVSLEKAKEVGLNIVPTSGSVSVDPDCVVLVGKCSTKKLPYIMKYERAKPDGIEQFINTTIFHLDGAYAVDNTYFDWSSGKIINEEVNTTALEGTPVCPHCNNRHAFGMCQCGKLVCIPDSGSLNCPWCNEHIQFDMSSGSGDFNVNRGQG